MIRIRAIAAQLLFVLLLIPEPLVAQITLDGSVGPEASLTGSDIQIGNNMGTQRGGNLFHSFRTFNIQTDQTVTFSGPDSVNNILARVTGADASRINGTLRSTIPGVNFVFINPNGLEFGPDAALDIGGSFFVGTANTLHFADGGVYPARPDGNGTLSVAAPSAFGFSEHNSSRIAINGTGLAVLPGRVQSYMGPEITIGETTQTTLVSPGGRIYLTTVFGAEQAPLLAPFNDGPTRGRIMIDNMSVIDVSNLDSQPSTGILFVRTGLLAMNQSVLNAQNLSDQDSVGGIDVRAQEMRLTGGALIASIALGIGRGSQIFIGTDNFLAQDRGGVLVNTQNSGGTGEFRIEAENIILDGGFFSSGVLSGDAAAGDIFITAESLLLKNGGLLSALTNAEGDAGDIFIVSDMITLDGRSENAADSTVGITADSSASATGNSGDIVVDAKSINLLGSALVSAGALTAGRGGTINIGTDTLVINGFGQRAGITTSVDGQANAGQIVINAQDIIMKNGGVIASGTAGDGDADRITIATENLFIDAEGNDVGTGIDAGVFAGGTGNGAILDLFVSGQFSILNGGRVQSASSGSGDAGSILIRAGDIDIAGIADSLQVTGIRSESSPIAGGASGLINIGATSLKVRRGGRISSSSNNDRAANIIFVDANDVVISGENARLQTGIVSGSLMGSGNGGIVVVRSERMRLQDRGQISAVTFSSGDAGAIVLNSDEIVIDGRVSRSRLVGDFRTGIVSSAAEGSAGDGGVIDIRAGSLLLVNNGVITAQSLGQGTGGSIVINVRDGFRADDSRVETTTLQSDGGNITLNAQQKLELNNSRITTSVSGGAGDGGNISIDPQFVILNGSTIQANAVGGNGGNIQIIAGTLFATPDSKIEASSSLGIDGQVVVDAPDDNVSEGLVVLEAGLLDAGRQLSQKCDISGSSARFASRGSGGIPTNPSVLQPAMLATATDPVFYPPHTPPQVTAAVTSSKMIASNCE